MDKTTVLEDITSARNFSWLNERIRRIHPEPELAVVDLRVLVALAQEVNEIRERMANLKGEKGDQGYAGADGRDAG